MAVIKAATGVGYAELSPVQYGLALAALKIALAAPKAIPTPKVVEADPFAQAAAPAAAPASAPYAAPSQTDAPSLEDVQKAARSAQGRTGTDKVQAVVMAHGGSAVDPSDGVVKPSLKALPVPAYADTIAALNALPKTK